MRDVPISKHHRARGRLVDRSRGRRRQPGLGRAKLARGGALRGVPPFMSEPQPPPTAGGGEPAGGGEGGGDAVDAGTGGGRSATLLSELPFRLPEFKNVLAKAGHDSELRNAVLYCRDGVSVRKATAATGGGDRLVVEGPLCDVYYEVRDLLYEQFVIL